jgi:acyl-CoA thioester hydrolase
MSAFRFTKRVEVRFRDCDPMGHVNNAVYLTYLEVARFAYWQHVFRGSGDAEAGFILARVECDFRAPAEAGDVLEVRLAVDRIGRSSFDFRGEIVRPGDGTLIHESRTVMVMYDYARSAAVPVPDEVRRRLEEFER